MKLYIANRPPEVIRVTFYKKREKGQFNLSFTETTIEDCREKLIKMIDNFFAQNPKIDNSKSTSILMRRCIGGKNFNSSSISFKGVDPETLYNFIHSKFQDNEQ